MMKQEHFYHQPIGISNRKIKNGKIEIVLPFNHLIDIAIYFLRIVR